MFLKVFSHSSKAEAYVAGLIAAQIRAKPHSVMGWATGGTMLGVYRVLQDMDLRFEHARSFNLDEYIGLPAEHPQSYHSYMQKNLFDHIDVAPERRHIPQGWLDPAQAVQRYQALLTRYGPIDFQLLGLGRNGHIGFNEPGAALDGAVRRTRLTPATVSANARYFESHSTVPREAVTMGIGSILSARRVVLLACGASKADAVTAMVEGSITCQCPASVLQKHDNVEIVLDEEAAAGLEARGSLTGEIRPSCGSISK